MREENLYYYDRVFRAYVFGNDASANEFMTAYPDTGVIYVDDDTGEVFVAGINDRGRAYVEGEIVRRANITKAA